jgi:hypothetical protein
VGGEIFIVGQPNQGTTVTMRVPMPYSEADERGAP